MGPPPQSGGIPELPMDDEDEEEKPKEQENPRESRPTGPQQEKKGERFVPPKVKCPKCANIIFVDKTRTTPDGKVKLECPSCGTTGSI